MNIRDGLPEIQAAFELLEGDYAARKMISAERYSLRAAIENRDRMLSRPFDPEWDDSFDSCGEIYGEGGYHRYYLYRNGEIAFSKSHGRDRAGDAADLGFVLV